MIKIFIYLFLLYILFRKMYNVIVKTIENYRNRKHFFRVQVADTPFKRKRGLMNIKKPLKENTGMLFDYKKEAVISLWMKNTYIPLDAIFMDSRSIVVGLGNNLKPHSLQNYSSNKKARYAIEVNAGTIKKKDIKIGDKIGTMLIKKKITDFS